MINFTKSVLFFLTITLISCGEKKEANKDKMRSDIRAKLDIKNKQESILLSEKQNAITGWDTTERYTYQLQELFTSNSNPISYTGIINDIIKKDSTYTLKLYSSHYYSYYKKFIAEVELSYSMLQEILKKQLESKKSMNKGCFIFKVTKIEATSPKLTADIDFGSSSDEDPSLFNRDDASSYLTFDYDQTLIKLKGKLIAFYLYERPKDIDN